MGLRMSRHWHREPLWFDGLARDIQIAVVAEYNLAHTPPEQLQKRKSAHAAAKLAAMRRAR